MKSGNGENGAYPPMRVLGFFAGVGGLELGLERAGHETILLCENDPSASRVLDAQFPHVLDRRVDVRSRMSLPRDGDLLTAGFPCQDLSQAGRRQGFRGEQSRLVNHVLSMLQRRRVPWVLLENVPFMLALNAGSALREILGKLERLGYHWAYRVVDTRAFGLPQRRERVFVVASIQGDPRNVLLADDAVPRVPRELNGSPAAMGFYWTEGNRGLGKGVEVVPTLKGSSGFSIPSPPAIWLPTGEIVTLDIRDAERLQGLPANWTKTAEEVDRTSVRWRLVGNAVSVPVARWIGRRLRRPGHYSSQQDRELGRDDRLPRAAWNVGTGAHASSVTSWPVRYKLPTLRKFLRHPTKPLSARATRGFTERLRRSYLRVPDGFLDALDRHIARMQE